MQTNPRRFQAVSDFAPGLPATGKGIGIAVLDSGIAPHPDLDDRVVAQVSTIPNSPGTCDFMGHGTHVASLAAGSGQASRGRFRGMAPEAHLINVRVTAGDEAGMKLADRYAALVQGLEWVLENRQRYNIRVVNMSVGYPLLAHRSEAGARWVDPLDSALRKAAEAGLVIVAAAGNHGDAPNSLAHTPASHPQVITVGSLDDQGTPEPEDDRVASFSSRGSTLEGALLTKGGPDLLAPGVNLMGAAVSHSVLEQRNDLALEQAHQLERAADSEMLTLARQWLGEFPAEWHSYAPNDLRQALMARLDPKATAGFLPNGHPGYIALHGTSMSAPIVAGLVACMLEINPHLGPEEVQRILCQTARPLAGRDPASQGAGVVNPAAALEATRQSLRER